MKNIWNAVHLPYIWRTSSKLIRRRHQQRSHQNNRSAVMPTNADKTQENKTPSVANAFTQKQSGAVSPFEWVDMRPKALAQRELQEMANNSLKIRQLSAWQEMAGNLWEIKNSRGPINDDKRLEIDGNIPIQRFANDQGFGQLAWQPGQTNVAMVIQRQLNEEDKVELIKYAKELLKVEALDEAWNKKIANTCRFFDNLKDAKRDIQQSVVKFSGVKQLPDNATNSLLSWIKPGQSVFAVTREVDMGDFSLTNNAVRVIYTISIMGCLGIAVYEKGKAFLAHLKPDQLGEKNLNGYINKLVEMFSTSASVYLITPSLTAPYVQDVRIALQKAGFQVKSETAQQRVAVNADTGELMFNFKKDELQFVREESKEIEYPYGSKEHSSIM